MGGPYPKSWLVIAQNNGWSLPKRMVGHCPKEWLVMDPVLIRVSSGDFSNTLAWYLSGHWRIRGALAGATQTAQGTEVPGVVGIWGAQLTTLGGWSLGFRVTTGDLWIQSVFRPPK